MLGARVARRSPLEVQVEDGLPGVDHVVHHRVERRRIPRGDEAAPGVQLVGPHSQILRERLADLPLVGGVAPGQPEVGVVDRQPDGRLGGEPLEQREPGLPLPQLAQLRRDEHPPRRPAARTPPSRAPASGHRVVTTSSSWPSRWRARRISWPVGGGPGPGRAGDPKGRCARCGRAVRCGRERSVGGQGREERAQRPADGLPRAVSEQRGGGRAPPDDRVPAVQDHRGRPADVQGATEVGGIRRSGRAHRATPAWSMVFRIRPGGVGTTAVRPRQGRSRARGLPSDRRLRSAVRHPAYAGAFSAPRRAELDADPGPHRPRRLRDRVLPGALAASAHDDQVAVAERSAYGGGARPAGAQRQMTGGAEREDRDHGVLGGAPAAGVAVPGDPVAAVPVEAEPGRGERLPEIGPVVRAQRRTDGLQRGVRQGVVPPEEGQQPGTATTRSYMTRSSARQATSRTSASNRASAPWSHCGSTSIQAPSPSCSRRTPSRGRTVISSAWSKSEVCRWRAMERA